MTDTSRLIVADDADEEAFREAVIDLMGSGALVVRAGAELDAQVTQPTTVRVTFAAHLTEDAVGPARRLHEAVLGESP